MEWDKGKRMNERMKPMREAEKEKGIKEFKKDRYCKLGNLKLRKLSLGKQIEKEVDVDED